MHTAAINGFTYKWKLSRAEEEQMPLLRAHAVPQQCKDNARVPFRRPFGCPSVHLTNLFLSEICREDLSCDYFLLSLHTDRDTGYGRSITPGSTEVLLSIPIGL